MKDLFPKPSFRDALRTFHTIMYGGMALGVLAEAWYLKTNGVSLHSLIDLGGLHLKFSLAYLVARTADITSTWIGAKNDYTKESGAYRKVLEAWHFGDKRKAMKEASRQELTLGTVSLIFPGFSALYTAITPLILVNNIGTAVKNR